MTQDTIKKSYTNTYIIKDLKYKLLCYFSGTRRLKLQ